MRRFFVFAVPLFAFTFFTCHTAQTQTSGYNLSAKTFDQRLREISNEILIDVRTPEEYAEGHLAGAINIDWEGKTFAEETAKLDHAKPVFVYCLAGGRSSDAAAALGKAGFKFIYNLEYGIEDWQKAGLPVTKN